MSRKQIRINKKTVTSMLTSMLSDMPKNVADIIIENLDEDCIDLVLHVLMTNTFIPVYIGDIVIIKTPETLIIDESEQIDHGLLPKSGYVFAEVKANNSWNSTYNEYLPTQKVNVLYYHDGKYSTMEAETSYVELEIPHPDQVKVINNIPWQK